MRALDLVAVVLVGGVLGGCARFHPQPLSPAKSVAEFESRTLADTGLKSFIETNLQRQLPAWPLPAWGFTNLSLAAFYYHPDLDVARAKWAVSRAGKKTAGERPNPTLSVAPAYNTTTHIPSPWLVTPTLDLPIETAGKRGYRLAQAEQLSEAARLNIASVAWQVRSRLRRSLLELYSATETERQLREQQALQAENIRLLEGQYSAGAISAFELTQARVAADSARLALREAERQSAEGRVQLADAIGIPATALEGVELAFEEFGGVPMEVSSAEARREALLNRADILGALAEYAASESALQLEIAKQYPDIHLNPGYEFDQGDNKWSIGLTVTLPVLSQNKGPIAEAESRRAESAATFLALQARVLSEIDRSLAAYHAATQKQADAEALMANLKKQGDAGKAMLDAGEISKAELTALRLQLSASSLARLEALTKAQQARAQLEDALQAPLGFAPTVWQSSPRVTQTGKQDSGR